MRKDAPRRAELTFAPNNGDVGGGEVMLLLLAEAARELGYDVRVVGPVRPAELVDSAQQRGLTTTTLPAHDRRTWMGSLRSWDRTRTGVLWCNGLVPAMATAGRRDRVVHLHREPEGVQRWARPVASYGARAVVVPSTSMGDRVAHTHVLANWTGPADVLDPPRHDDPVVGFLGRLTRDKGVHLLAEAVTRLPGTRLLVGGDPRFGDADDERVVGTALEALGDRVVRLGWVDREDLLSRVDVLVVPSVWAEPFGLVAAEAMAAGVPVVVSDAGALPEVVGPDHPWVVRAGDVLSLAAMIETVTTASPHDRAAVCQQARARWEQHYSPSAGRDRLGRLLADVAGPPA